nr:uncharacterized protein LOC109183154 [Ipomoea batatas]
MIHQGKVWRRKTIERPTHPTQPGDKPAREPADKGKRLVINVIFKGWATASLEDDCVRSIEKPSALKKQRREDINFSDSDLSSKGTSPQDALVILMGINGTIVMYLDVFTMLGFAQDQLCPVKTLLVGFTGDTMETKGSIRLPEARISGDRRGPINGASVLKVSHSRRNQVRERKPAISPRLLLEAPGNRGGCRSRLPNGEEKREVGAVDVLRYGLTEGRVSPCRPLPCTAGVSRRRRDCRGGVLSARSLPEKGDRQGCLTAPLLHQRRRPAAASHIIDEEVGDGSIGIHHRRRWESSPPLTAVADDRRCLVKSCRRPLPPVAARKTRRRERKLVGAALIHHCRCC